MAFYMQRINYKMLDEKGIKLAEISTRYPRTFQTLGYDALLDVDECNKPKVVSSFKMCINIILTLLFMKPGQYPSIPDLGIDIEKYLHEYADDRNIPMKIRDALDDQCNRLQISGLTYDIFNDITADGINALVIDIKGTERLAYGSESTHVIIGITYDKLNRLYVKHTYI